MKHDLTLHLIAENNFSVLNRIINILNRRRVRIKKLIAHENEEDFHRGGVTMVVLGKQKLAFYETHRHRPLGRRLEDRKGKPLHPKYSSKQNAIFI